MSQVKTRYCIVFNPVSGNKNPALTEKTIRSFFDKHTLSYTFIRTRKGQDIAEIVRKHVQRDCDVVVAAGGDGTISRAVNAVYGTRAVLGIIPVGSANTVAREMGIPLDTESACTLLLHPDSIRVTDVMKVNGEPFVMDVSVGINALTMRDTKRKHKRIFGLLAYIVTAVKWAFGYKSRRFTIVADGSTYFFSGAEVLIANGGILKNLLSKVIPDDATSTDGMLDVIVVRARKLSDYLKIIWYLILNKRTSESRVNRLQVKDRVTVFSSSPLPVQGDGEIIGETPVTVRFRPKTLSIIVPKSSHAKTHHPRVRITPSRRAA
jgi:YegS/Rv2252/BmrU family lipid kinase